jgi:hypothetical protein
MAATYCGMLRDSRTLKEAEKLKLWSEFSDRVFKFENTDYKPAPAKPAQAPRTKGKGAEVPTASPKPATGNIVQGPGSVLSVNQQGGITAGQVNIGIPERHLTPEQKEAIVSAVQGKACKISSMGYDLGASDARGFAFEIQAALSSGGCEVPKDMTPAYRKSGTNRGIFVQYYDPVTYSLGDKLTIADETTQGMLIGMFIKAHLPVSAAPTPNVSKNDVQVFVGAP